MRLAVLALIATGCLVQARATVVPKQRIGPLSAGWHEANVDGVKLAYEVRGRGPVCFVHAGGPGLESTYLRLEGIEKVRTLVYVEALGNGRSGKLPDGQQYSIARDVAAVEALRQHIGLDRVCLIGHSYGGFVAMEYALAHRDHASAMVLYSTTPTTGKDIQKLIEANLKWFANQPWFNDAMKGDAAEKAAKTDDELTAAVLVSMPFYFADWSHRGGEFQRRLAVLRASVDVSNRRPDEDAWDLRPRLGEIRVPTLVIAGKRDFLAGEVPSGWLRDGIAGAKLVVIDDAGHFAHFEQPAAFDRAIAAFLRE